MGAMTQSLEDYLEAVYRLIEASGSACVRDVAKLLDVKMPSVVKAIHELKSLELVIQEPYSSIELTAKGARLARSVHARHKLLTASLVKFVKDPTTTEIDTCRMEHILSAETLDKIRTYTGKS